MKNYLYPGLALGIMLLLLLLVQIKEKLAGPNPIDFQSRNIQKTNGSTSPLINFQQQATKYLDLVKNPTFFNAQNCTQQLRPLIQQFQGLSSEQIDYEKAEKLAVKTYRSLWSLRLALHQALQNFYEQQKLNKSCAFEIRNAFRIIRYIEDEIGSMAIKKLKLPFSKNALQNDGISLLVNSKYQNFDGHFSLQSGDIILSRGQAFTSAFIARLSDHESQFSHLSLVYVPEESNDIKTIEAHIEKGTVYRSINEHLKDKNVRAMVLRAKEKSHKHYGENGASMLWQTQENFPYDFQMRSDDRNEFFCSEIVQYAYQVASDGVMQIPAHLSHVSQNLNPLLSRLTIKGNDLFIPSDIEIDPRFDIVAEWRDFSQIKDSQLKDIVLGQILSWIKNKNYHFKTIPLQKLKANFAVLLRNFPLISKTLQDRLPSNMPSQTLETIFYIDLLSEVLFSYAKANNLKFKQMHGHDLTPLEIKNFLETFRENDWRAYLEKKNALPLNKLFLRESFIHWFFLPTD